MFKRRSSYLFSLLSLGIILLIFFQNCGNEEGTGNIFVTSTGCPSCAAQEDVNLLAIELASNVVIPLSENSSTTTNLSITGGCHNGNFAKNIIRWQIRDELNRLKLYGTTFCRQGDSGGYYSIRRSVSSSQLTAQGNEPKAYQLNLVISGFTRNNTEVTGPNSDFQSIAIARNTIKAPKLYEVAVNGMFPSTNRWSSKLRAEKTAGSDTNSRLSNYLHGLCNYTNSQNDVKITLTKAGAEPLSNYQNHITVLATCKSLSAAKDGYNGYFFYDGQESFSFFNPSVDYEGCVSGNTAASSAICQQRFGSLQNRFYDITTSQIDVAANSTLVSDKKVFSLIFSTNPITSANQFNGKNWSLDIMLELFKRIKISLDYASSPNNVSLINLSANDLLQAYQIFAGPEAMNDDEDKNSSNVTLFESPSTRKFVLYLLGLTERRESGAAVNPTTPMKILNVDSFASTLYKQQLSSLSGGYICDLGPNRPLKGFNSEFTDAANNIEAQRIALCLTAKYHLGMYYESADLMYKALSQGVNYISCTNEVDCRCETQNDRTTLAPMFCANLRWAIFHPVKDIMTAKLGAGSTFANASNSSNSTVVTAAMDAARAIAQYMVNAIMINVANNNQGILDKATKAVLVDKGLESLQNDSAVLSSLRPNEVNFSGGVKFAAYTSFNIPGSTSARGSVPVTPSTP